ncbi:AfsR/SARP family transcriptional regulator [Actinophytocola sp.]|uniref:AfsR/SARP family transcriptional regulator n=1 Tax=Actinophytocola sp. TaxID=1872138 RepID=UPI0039C8803A
MVVRARGCRVPPRGSVEASLVVSVTYRISVFGPVTVFVDDIALKLEGPQSSHVLAVLAIRLGTPVRRADLVNEVWATRPEPKTVDSRISRLRDVLRRAPGLEIPRADSSGYCLRAERGRIDLHRFTDLASHALSAAQESRPDAEKLLRQALELCRSNVKIVVPPWWRWTDRRWADSFPCCRLTMINSVVSSRPLWCATARRWVDSFPCCRREVDEVLSCRPPPCPADRCDLIGAWARPLIEACPPARPPCRC